MIKENVSVISDLKPMLRLMRSIANSAAEVFCWQHDGRGIISTYEEMRAKYVFDLSKLSNADIKLLGFDVWDVADENNECLYLCPLWFYPFLPVGTELHSINGNKFVIGGHDAIDLDTRFGCISYGLLRKEE